MPSKDPQKRKATMEAWRERAHTPEYMRWLGARRKLKMDAASYYEGTLLLIARTTANPRKYANDALALIKEREIELGNRYNHVENKPYYKEG